MKGLAIIMYLAVRLTAIFLITILIYYQLVKKGRLSLRILLICSFVSFIIAGFIPFEDILGFRFKTPENAFLYQESGEIIEVIEGKNSAVVVAQNSSNGIIYCLFPKDKRGWMLKDILIFRDIKFEHYSRYRVVICRAGNIHECIIIVEDISLSDQSDLKITDSQGTQFKEIFMPEKEYFSIVNAPDPHYELYINDEKVLIESSLLSRKYS